MWLFWLGYETFTFLCFHCLSVEFINLEFAPKRKEDLLVGRRQQEVETEVWQPGEDRFVHIAAPVLKVPVCPTRRDELPAVNPFVINLLFTYIIGKCEEVAANGMELWRRKVPIPVVLVHTIRLMGEYRKKKNTRNIAYMFWAFLFFSEYFFALFGFYSAEQILQKNHAKSHNFFVRGIYKLYDYFRQFKQPGPKRIPHFFVIFALLNRIRTTQNYINTICNK